MKTCYTCKQITTNFGRSKRNKDGLKGSCRTCESAYMRKHRSMHEDTRTAKSRLNETLKRKYNITEETYNEMLLSQNSVCAICSKPCSLHWRLSVDHCHKTGEVRGLLCHRCNCAMGKFNDDPILLSKASDYLRKY